MVCGISELIKSYVYPSISSVLYARQLCFGHCIQKEGR